MDNLTHGLLGLAIGALVPAGAPRSQSRKAALLAGVLAAELPDLDTLWPAANEVVHALHAHRGVSHSLIASPVVALVSAAVAWRVFKGARFGILFLTALLSVLLAHLLADVWTGWGTRLLLPFSDERLTLDWTMVIDPLITVPLLIAAIWAARRPERWRRAAAIALVIVGSYLSVRIAIRAVSLARVRAAHPEAVRVDVFPAWFTVARWRYVAILPDEFRAGVISWNGAIEEQSRVPRSTSASVTSSEREIPTVREALAWARFPVVSRSPGEQGGVTISIADLRYHLSGRPTLTFVIALDASNRVTSARLDRGGSARELLERWRGKP